MSFFASVAVQWFLRRILDWGGWFGGFLLFVINTYNSLPPPLQVAVTTVIEGNWQEITLGSLIPIGGLVWSQVQSFRATVRPQIVTDGKSVPLRELPHAKQVAVEEYAISALGQQKDTLIGRMLKWGKK